MKRIVAIGLCCLMLSFSLVACGKKATADSSAEAPTSSTVDLVVNSEPTATPQKDDIVVVEVHSPATATPAPAETPAPTGQPAATTPATGDFPVVPVLVALMVLGIFGLVRNAQRKY